MTTPPIAAYSFFPWTREGLGAYMREGDPTAMRGSIEVGLQISAERIGGGTVTEIVSRQVQTYGPGDIIGIDQRAIVRTEPRNWITNFEPNYLPFIEFYEEDFPWRYTPIEPSPDNKRLLPWLALVVLEEGEFIDGKNLLDRPLPYIEVENAAEKFPPFEQMWLWAHVHVNGALGSYTDDLNVLAAKLNSEVQPNRDIAYSRLLCPRILKANMACHAFLISSFETGRLAGLKLDPTLAGSKTRGAWENYDGREQPNSFPYYHRWYFRTGAVGDFEYLVRLLQARPISLPVGQRDCDMRDPGSNLDLPGIPELGGILRLGGALRVPLDTLSPEDREEYERFERWGEPYPHVFQTSLAALINLSSDYTDSAPLDANNASGLPLVAGDEDPWIVPPIYGGRHSHPETHRLVAADGDPARQRWVHELNLDPRHRIAAGFGTQVVQKNQENYMEAAWKQVGKVLEANSRIRYGQMAKATTLVWHSRELAALQKRSPERFLMITAPVQRRMLADGLTIHHQVQRSALPLALTSKTMRQVLRPHGRVARRIGFDGAYDQARLLARASRGEISAAPPRVTPSALPTGEKLASWLPGPGLPEGWLDAFERYPWLRYLLLALAVVLALIVFLVAPLVGVVAGATLALGAIWLIQRTDAALRRRQALKLLSSEERTPEDVDRMPFSPDFRIGLPGEGPASTRGDHDSAEAIRFKEALRNLYAIDVAEREIPAIVRQPLALEAVAQASLVALHPVRTIQPRVLATISIPARIRDRMKDPFGEVMIYPEIDLPMYAPLKDISTELFLPNIQLIENNSITLLETNQKFIEAYMVGLNHEFARELLWREYPTDQRGSYFRQFWDVNGYLVQPGVDREALRERLFDIPPLHTWPVNTGLGSHDNREAYGDRENEVVLVIRGELLKKYPTAVIYAHRAEWEQLDGELDKTRPRKLAELTEEEEADPPRNIVKTPLYEAKVDPDIYFFGFDITTEQARGGQIVDGVEDPGWFFVIKERPGEPRFGLDLPKPAPQEAVNSWSDLALTDVLTNFDTSLFLRTDERAVTLTPPAPDAPDGLQGQYNEDRRFQWLAGMHAAELAYILFQLPVLMAVHAAEMLKEPT